MATENKSVGAGIACHAWNKDGSMIALSPNSSDVHIYRTNNSENIADWTLLHTLSEHSEFVSSVDWSHVTDKIVTCGHDRNAYVWSFDNAENKWKPSLVILRINRAATCVRWSPDGKKFAVASGAKVVPVCHYEESNSWWISKMIKKHKSTILSLAWSPNSRFLITGCTDYKARIFSAFLKEVDSPQDDGLGSIWADQNRFGEILCEFDDAHAWVHTVAWSPSGTRVAFAGHGSTVTFGELGNTTHTQTVRAANLPFLDIAFLSDQALVAVGFDCSPVLFTVDANSSWKLQEDLDKREEKKAESKQSGFATAKNIFQQSVTKGVQINNEQNKVLDDIELKSRHQNTITSVCRYKPTVISTAGIDGRVFFWDLSKIGVDVASLGIA